MTWDLLSIYRPANRARMLALGAALGAAIAVADWATDPFISLGFLYLFPLIAVSGFLPRWQILAAAMACAALGEAFANLPSRELVVRLGMSFAGFAGTGLFVSEVVRKRRMIATHLEALEAQALLRQDAEEQLRALVESSPAAIVTVDAEGLIRIANEAAHRLFEPAQAPLGGRPIAAYLPSLRTVVGRPAARPFRTTLQCTGRRSDGTVFLAGVWFSTYRTLSGPLVAAIVVDLSDELRSREDLSLDHLLRHSRIVMSAVAHEIRNLSSAALVTHTNLSRIPSLVGNEDFQALGTLIRGLEKIAGMELDPMSGGPDRAIDVRSVLEELRVLTTPSLEEEGIEANWAIPPDLPLVWGDRYGLIQVFINLVRNSRHALRGVEARRLTVSASAEGDRVVVRVEDTGAGVRSPETLFRPFQRGAESTGLGLYVSRTILRSGGGDLAHVPTTSGACFHVTLRTAPGPAGAPAEASTDAHA